MSSQRASDTPSILIRRAYTRLREWYQSNARRLLGLAPQGSSRAQAIAKSLSAIEALPPESTLTDLEIRVVLFEVTSGIFSWSYWDKIDDRGIYEFVASTL